jgi:signal transduction histidine kinase
MNELSDLETAREETDASLADERVQADALLDHATALLATEEIALDASRSTVERRDELLAVVSHDLRIPLASIVMNADVIAFHVAPDGPSGKRVQACAAEIVAACEQMQHLVEDLLDVTAMDAPRFDADRVRQVLTSLCKAIVEAHGGRIEVSSEGRGTEIRFTLPGA